MRATVLPAAVVVAVLALFCATAPAQFPTTMNYQVMLTDDADQPLVDQAVELVFRLYEGPVGGPAMWTETHNTMTNAIGVVSAVLGSTNPLDLDDFPGALYLEVDVDGETMSPRRELTSAPYALDAYNAHELQGHSWSELGDPGTVNDPANPVDWSQLKNVPAGFADGTDDVGGAGDGHSLDASDGSQTDQVYVNASGNVGIGLTSPNEDVHVYDGTGLVYQRFTNSTTGTGVSDGFKIGINGAGNGYIHQYEAADINFSTNGVFCGKFDDDGTFELGNNAVDGGFEFYGAGSLVPIIEFSDDGGDGGEMTLRHAATGTHTVIEVDSSDGTSGYLYMYGGGSGYFLVEGAVTASTGPRVTVGGTSSTTTIDGSSGGDDSVLLPTDAISDSEILDEAGVTSNVDAGPFELTGGVDALETTSISTPASGKVLVIGTLKLYINHTSGNASGVIYGVSDASGSIPSDGNHECRVPSGCPTGLYIRSASVHGVFDASSAATHDYYLLADAIAPADVDVYDSRVTAVYLPTAYGSVEAPTRGPSAEHEDTTTPARPPLSELDIMQRRAESIAANQARIDAELAAMRAEIEEMKSAEDGDQGGP